MESSDASAPGVANCDPSIADFDTVRQSNPKYIALQMSDPDDGQTSIISATGATKGAVRQNLLQSGIITYVPEMGWSRTDTVTYVVSDGRGGALTGTIHVHVRASGDGPATLDFAGNGQVSVPGTLEFSVSASDNGDYLPTYTICAPAGATIDNATGAFGWTPAASDAGDHTFTVTVCDDKGGSAT